VKGFIDINKKIFIYYYYYYYYYGCLLSNSFISWWFSWTSGDPHRSGFNFTLQYFPFNCLL